MFSRTRISLVLAVFLALVLAAPVFAGGWAVITLDELPSNVVAGEPLTIGFTVLQHGKTPMIDLSPIIVANLYKDEEIKVFAEPEGEPGHYAATLTFPKEGDWQWSIKAFTMDQEMPRLSVSAPPKGAAANPPVVQAEPATRFASPTLILSAAVLALGFAGAFIGLRRRSRPVMALTVVCLLAGLALMIVETGSASAVEAQTQSKAEVVQSDSSLSQVEYGRQLFIAKGCITCHYNSKAASRSEHWTIETGAPDLSSFSASPEVLFIRLKDPSAAKSDTQMPDLGLREAEIEALVAFINSK
jgi:hypothetical protein